MSAGQNHRRKHLTNRNMRDNNKNRGVKKQKEAATYLADDSNAPSIRRQLQALGLEPRDIVGDGNCLFRALADQLYGTDRDHFALRQQICDFIEASVDHFQPFLEEPIQSYIAKLREAGNCGGNDCLAAMSQLHHCDIVIHQLGMDPWTVMSNSSSSRRRQLHIVYHNGEHYSSVRQIGDHSSNPTNIHLYSKSKEAEKLRDSHDELVIELLMRDTGCRNKLLVEQTHAEHDGDVDAAMAELVQLKLLDEHEHEHDDRAFDDDTSTSTCDKRKERMKSRSNKRLNKQLKKERAAARRRADIASTKVNSDLESNSTADELVVHALNSVCI